MPRAVLNRLVLDRLGDRWSVRLITALAERPRRYVELARLLGIAQKVLTQALKSLARDGFVRRTVNAGGARYGLTELGRSFHQLAAGIERWSDRHAADILAAQAASEIRPEPPPHAAAGIPGPVARPTAPALSDMPLAEARLTHISLAVHDVERLANAYAALLGVPRPSIFVGQAAVPDGTEWPLKMCIFRLKNCGLELIQPLDGASPHANFIAHFGDGAHHLGFGIPDDLHERARLLTQKGGAWTGGTLTTPYADVDFMGTIGITLQMLPHGSAVRYVAGASDVLSPPQPAASGGALTHVGFIVRDIARASRMYAGLVGAPMPAIRELPRIAFAPGASAGRSARAKVAYIRRDNIVLRLIEPSGGPSPWRNFLDEHGNGVHHIGLDVGQQFDRAIALCETSGQRILGRPSGTAAQFDMEALLGVNLELHGVHQDAARATALAGRPPVHV